jgi:hypothetical protein
MRDRPYLDEHSDLVSLGLLAEGVVFAAAALRRPRRLSKHDRMMLEAARSLLATITEPASNTQDVQVSHNFLLSDSGALEALRATEREVPGQDVQQFLSSLIALIDDALAGSDMSGREPQISALQRVFASLGNVTLAQANSLATPLVERFLWTSGPLTFVSS